MRSETQEVLGPPPSPSSALLTCVMPEPVWDPSPTPPPGPAQTPGKGGGPCIISKHGAFNSSFLWGWTPPLLASHSALLLVVQPQ